VILGRRDPVGRERTVHRHRQRDPDRQPRVDQADRAGPADSGEEQRADAEQRRRQQRPGGVVDTEGAGIPLGRLAPRDRCRGDGVRRQRPGPGGELRAAAGPPAARERAGEPERDESGGEGDEGVHGDLSLR
jgi:hypothetical protein